MKFRYNGFFDLEYDTELSAAECIARITAAPYVFQSEIYSATDVLRVGEEAKERNYDCYLISENQLHLTLKGGRFTKPRRSQFVMELLPGKNTTTVLLKFQGDLLEPFLMTPTAEIDSFMRERIQGVRKMP